LSSTPEPSVDPPGGVRLAFWVLAVLVFVSAITAAYQTQHVAELNEKVAVLNGELSTVRTQLHAYQGRLVEIRGAVSHLQYQLGELDELVGRDPLAGASQ
jgi:ABC-type hemin transport system substrate-binding protein